MTPFKIEGTAQEIFDKVSRHLLTQGEQSVSEDGGKCRYRSPSGLSCAVGCLLPDDVASTCDELRASGIDNLIGRGLVASYCRDLLVDLQWMHDKKSPVVWPLELRRMAAKHGLDFTPPVQESK